MVCSAPSAWSTALWNFCGAVVSPMGSAVNRRSPLTLVMKAVLSLALSASGSEKNADCKSIFESHLDPARRFIVSSAKGIG